MKLEKMIKDRLWDLFFLAIGSGIVAVIWLVASIFIILFGE